MFKKYLMIGSLLLIHTLYADINNIEKNWYEGVQDYGQELEITKIEKDSFSFRLDSMARMNVGQIDGQAKIYKKDNSKAIFEDTRGCKIEFSFENESLELTTTDKCIDYGGMGTYFGGKFTSDKHTFYPVNIKQLKKEIKAIKTTDKLFKYLTDKNMIDTSKIENKSIDKNIVKLEVDVFKKNLFGSQSEETILQVRVTLESLESGAGGEFTLYAVSFYEGQDDYITKIPSNITISQDYSMHTPCGQAEDKYFIFDYKELNIKDEFAILGKIYSGYCGSSGGGGADSFSMLAWQIYEDGINKLFDINTYTYSYQSPSPTPIEYGKSDIAFVNAGESTYPKKLKITDYVFGTSECHPDECDGTFIDASKIIDKKVSYQELKFK